MIHIIGDSHALTFQGAKDVEVHWMGAATAFNLWKKNKEILNILKKFVARGEDGVWFCFGEIDCRIHTYNKSCELFLAEEFIIHNTVNSYCNYVQHIMDYEEDVVQVLTAPPQGFQENYFEYPNYASRERRQYYTDEFNSFLYDYLPPGTVVDIWKPEAAYLWPEEDFQEDKCHIKPEIAIARLEKYIGK